MILNILFKFGFECIKRTYFSNFNGKAVPCNFLKHYRKFAIICSSKFDVYDHNDNKNAGKTYVPFLCVFAFK